jgi:protein-S-isoprenylcysteine O-methyltransferase Ste14
MTKESVLRSFAALRGIVYAAGFIAIWAWLAIVVRRFDADLAFDFAPALRPLGFALAVVGAFVTASCVVVFATRGRGTPAVFDAPRFFVASGPYRFVRNPMYLGAAAVIAGAGIVLHSPSIVLLAAGFLAFFHVFVLVHEEPALRERFGASYADYQQSVHRWLPSPRALLVVVVALAFVYALAALILE